MDEVTVGAVVTAFHPDSILEKLIKELARQVSHILVVDNTPESARTVDGKYSAHNVEYIFTGKNLGLAAALNRGVKHLKRHSLTHISFWDQDSIPPPEYVRKALARSRSFAHWPNVIVSGHHMAQSDAITRNPGVPEQEVIRLITSGMIVPVHVLQSVGPFREDFFVDDVDTDFSLRARAQNVPLYLLRDLMIRHRLGDPSRGRRPLLSRSKTSGHPTWRQYWISRNETILIGEYRHLDIEAVRLIKKDQVHWFLRNLLAGPDRLSLMIAIIAGRKDARKGRVRKRYDPRQRELC